MNAAVVLSAQSVVKSYGAQPVLDGISLSVHEGERIGLIGRNGSGKSTLLKILAGVHAPDAGEVTRRQGLRVGMLFQECALDESVTVSQALEGATAESRERIDEHEALADALASTPDGREHDTLQEKFDALNHELHVRGAWNLEQEADTMMQELRLPAPERVLGSLSGGELRRVDLAVTLLGKPDVLLLDEPTNHIDTQSAAWVETFLTGYKGSCVLVTHDRYFLELVVSRIVEIEFNRLYSFPGNYKDFLEHKAQLQEVETKTEQSRQNVLRRELEWLRRGPKARSTKQKARKRRYEELDAQGGPALHKDVSFEIPQPRRLGKVILETDQLSFAIDGRTLFEKFTLIMQERMRVGVVGPNGCGKTTLIRILMGIQDGFGGSLRIGDTTEFLYIDQSHHDIDPEQSVLDFVSGGANHWDVNGRRMYVPAYLERLLFDMDSVRSPVGNLSGGERNRMDLARKLLQGGNFLVLDEPTNDLDLPTLRVLEDAVMAFQGCAFVVSHDRYFLNRVCTHLVVFEENEPLYFSAGDYDDYLLFRNARKHERTPPHSSRQKRGPRKAREASGLKRLTYKEREELTAMESEIETAEAKVAGMETAVNEPGFYEQPHDRVRETLDALESAKMRSAELYSRWEELESRSSLK